MEALAAASSVLAVVSLALQLADNVQRLIEFWNSVKDAPAEVLEIRSQLRILGALLRSIELDGQQSPSDDGDSLGHDCLLVCNASVAKLEKLSNGWSRELGRIGIRRKWSCLKKALREHELARYWTELERAKSTLLMYQCLRNGQRQDSLHRAIMRMRLTPLEDYQQPTITRIIESDMPIIVRNKFKKIHLGTKIYELHLSFGIIRIRMARESVIDGSTQRNHMSLMKRPTYWRIIATFLPKIKSWKTLECTFNRKYNSIDAGLQTFNMRPEWSPIFDCASHGDMQGMRRLIEDGLASPNDVDPDGWTVLHFAAAAHQASVCHMLLALGAVPDPVTKRQETPLLLATRSNCQDEYRPVHDKSASINTLRVLVEQGNNDPMHSNDIGWTSIFKASNNLSGEALEWLINQTEYELDFKYTTPGGLTAAALFVQREDLSATLFQPLLRGGIKIDAPCAEKLGFQRFRIESIDLFEPSMIQYAVCSWYEKLLNSYEPKFPYGHSPPAVPSPIAVIKTLLDNGADFYCNGSYIPSLLQVLVVNIIQFDGDERPAEVLRAYLGFNLKDYLRIEAEKQKGKSLNMGIGVEMFVCFDEDTAPHIWTVFQGPFERKKGVFVDRISKCANWKEWQFRYSLPKRPAPLKEQKYFEQSAEILILKKYCGCPSFDAHLQSCMETKQDTELSQTPPITLTSSFSSRKRKIVSIFLYYVISGKRYRHEFTFYVFVLACFFGWSYFARFWIAGGFFLALKLLQDTISYWV
ncbi:ankyrin [Stipitochalara longipes BDJ]|nr:ankyrin [Stipitochalara longipes BDJ]